MLPGIHKSDEKNSRRNALVVSMGSLQKWGTLDLVLMDGHGHADSDAGATVQVRVALCRRSSSVSFVSAEASPIPLLSVACLRPG